MGDENPDDTQGELERRFREILANIPPEHHEEAILEFVALLNRELTTPQLKEIRAKLLTLGYDSIWRESILLIDGQLALREIRGGYPS